MVRTLTPAASVCGAAYTSVARRASARAKRRSSSAVYPATVANVTPATRPTTRPAIVKGPARRSHASAAWARARCRSPGAARRPACWRRFSAARAWSRQASADSVPPRRRTASDQALPEMPERPPGEPGPERVDRAQATVRPARERTAGAQGLARSAHAVGDAAREGAELAGASGAEPHEGDVLGDRGRHRGRAMVAKRHPHRVADERVVDAARRPYGRLDEVGHAHGRRVDQRVVGAHQAEREIPALVADEERRPVAAGRQERVAPACGGTLEDVAGLELGLPPSVGIPRVTPVAA